MATKNDEITEILKLIAPGTPIRDGLENILKAKNPAGTITDDLWETIGQAMELSGDGNCHVIEVDGEEDLAVLPCILMASDETTILYGQPNEGLVLLKVYDAKDYAQNLIDTFIKE
jgi:uncharacterized protein (UPF0218 family)